MSEGDDTARPRLGAKKPGAGYEVGYGRPPQATRFKAGTSGNPGGRPRGSNNKPSQQHFQTMEATILAEASRVVSVQENARQVRMTTAQAVMRSLSIAAIQGNVRAGKVYTDLVSTASEAKRVRDEAYFNDAIAYKQAAEERIEDCKRSGLPIPNILPHPDHVRINYLTRTVHIIGPVTYEQKRAWDELAIWRDQLTKEITSNKAELRRLGRDDEGMRAIILSELDGDTRRLARFAEIVGDYQASPEGLKRHEEERKAKKSGLRELLDERKKFREASASRRRSGRRKNGVTPEAAVAPPEQTFGGNGEDAAVGDAEPSDGRGPSTVAGAPQPPRPPSSKVADQPPTATSPPAPPSPPIRTQAQPIWTMQSPRRGF